MDIKVGDIVKFKEDMTSIINIGVSSGMLDYRGKFNIVSEVRKDGGFKVLGRPFIWDKEFIEKVYGNYKVGDVFHINNTRCTIKNIGFNKESSEVYFTRYINGIRRYMSEIDEFKEMNNEGDVGVIDETLGLKKPEKKFCDTETAEELKEWAYKSIKDSGERSKFISGAVRDLSIGKGRTDLLPLNVVAKLMKDMIMTYIANFQQTRKVKWLYATLDEVMQEDKPYMILELSKHFEKGALKYEERNWEKGIPTHRYIDSAVRHYLKYLNGEEDEDHFVSFQWNILCLIWTIENIGDDLSETHSQG